MNEYQITYEGWNGSENIKYMTKQYMQYLQDKGAEIEEVILIIKSGEMFNGFFYMYDPGEKVKTTLIKFKYKGQNMCVNKDAVNVNWENTIRNTTNEALSRCEKIDTLNSTI